jgi:hypothetical protein
MLKGIFQWLKQTAKNIKLWDGKRKYIPKRKQGRKRYTLTLFEVFVLTLVRIIGYDTNHLSFLFGISQSHVCRINGFSTYISEQSIMHRVFGNSRNDAGKLSFTNCLDGHIINCSKHLARKFTQVMNILHT